MSTFSLTINNKVYVITADAQTPLLWVLRENVGLTGTKYGCGIGQCGACTVHLSGTAVRSCSLPVSTVQNKKITTIEGLSENCDHPVQQAWIEESVPQCGYCQSGQVMTAVALLQKNSAPSESEIEVSMRGNICRCGTYIRIKKAIKRASELIQQEGSK